MMTTLIPGKFTLGTAIFLIAVIAAIIAFAGAPAVSVQGSGQTCEYDEVLMQMYCNTPTAEPTPEPPSPAGFDPARWMPRPDVHHDGTVRVADRDTDLVPPMPPIDGFEYSFDWGSGSPSYVSEVIPASPVRQPEALANTHIPESSNSGNPHAIPHRIIYGFPDAKTPPPPPPIRIWFKDEGYGPMYQASPQSRLRIATGPFIVPVTGFDWAADHPPILVGSTSIAAAWNRLKPYTFEDVREWKNFDPILVNPETYDTAEFLRIHKAEAKRRVRLMGQESVATFPNARNVRITVDPEVEVIQEPNPAGGPAVLYTFIASVTVSGTYDGLVLNEQHPSNSARRDIVHLVQQGLANHGTVKTRVNGRDYGPFLSSAESMLTVVGTSTTVDGTQHTRVNVIHQINLDGTIVFGVSGVERNSVEINGIKYRPGSGCISGCLGSNR